jgi:hypothetical protein
MKLFTGLFVLIALAVLAVSCGGGPTTPVTTATPTTPPYTSAAPTTPVETPSVTPTGVVTVLFDLDTGLPALFPGRNTPLEQSSGGITASFSSSADPAAFSVQTGVTTSLVLSKFSTNFLYDNSAVRKSLSISFSRELTRISLVFATTDSHGPGNIEDPSEVKLTAYLDSTGAPLGSIVVRGAYGPDSFPLGELVFDSPGQPFNLVTIELVPQPRGGPSFYIDNIAVTTSG